MSQWEGGDSPPPDTQTKPVRVSYVDWVARQWVLIPPCHQRLHACELTGFVFSLLFSLLTFYFPPGNIKQPMESSSCHFSPRWRGTRRGGKGGVGLLFFSKTVSDGSLPRVDRMISRCKQRRKLCLAAVPGSVGVGGWREVGGRRGGGGHSEVDPWKSL